MKNHIKQAQYSFDFIFNQIEKINQGQQIFDIGFLKSILDSNTNNEIYEYLKNLLKYIEEFGDKTPKDLNIIEIISRTLGKSSSLKKEPIITSLGEYPGHDYIDIHLLCLDILDRLKFTYFADVFKIICQLSIDENEKIKLKALDVASNMSKFIYWPKQKKYISSHKFLF
ncbi:hypothetical protein lpari_03719 [Legionella parisiensis]|uniref:Uncharacterized protein n=2 Tax=Legionella parisiensis TaxID=45071 RepID=A0A1E5JL88_9GAMM|nr:hypothetical protein lpari_03719 [Legionella parisiensis]